MSIKFFIQETLLVLCGFILFLTSGCKTSTTESTPEEQENYKIAFVAYRGENDVGIYIMNYDGMNLMRFT
jgi:hypothetical protein